jgi:hypothetical protein
LWNGGTSFYICTEIALKNKCLYVIINVRFFSVTICNLLTCPRINNIAGIA